MQTTHCTTHLYEKESEPWVWVGSAAGEREPCRGRGAIRIDQCGGDEGIRKDKSLDSFLPVG